MSRKTSVPSSLIDLFGKEKYSHCLHYAIYHRKQNLKLNTNDGKFN